MARLKPKEFDPTFLLKIKKEKEKILGDALKISAEPYTDRPLTPKEVEEKQKNQPGTSPYLPGKSPIPSKGLAHHTGGKHFTEPSMDELIQGLINGDVPRGTLGDEETENRMIQEYLNKQSLKIGMSKKDDDINWQLINNSGGANPEDYLTPKQFERYKRNPERFIDIDIDLVKTPSQQNATNMRELIKKLTKEGKHIEAQALYREQFPRA
jgi:hypothetical protein